MNSDDKVNPTLEEHDENEPHDDAEMLGAQEPLDINETAEPAAENTDARELAQDETRIEDLNLAQLLGRLLRSPRDTWRRASLALAGQEPIPAPATALVNSNADQPRQPGRALSQRFADALRQPQRLQLLLFALALVSALIGTNALLGRPGAVRSAENTLQLGAPFLWLGFFIWLLGEAVGNSEQLRQRWRRMSRRERRKWTARILPVVIWLSALQSLSASMAVATSQSFDFLLDTAVRFLLGFALWHLFNFVAAQDKTRIDENPISTQQDTEATPEQLAEPGAAPGPAMRDTLSATQPRALWAQIGKRRLSLAAFSALASAALWFNTGGNRIEPPFILLWIISSLSWSLVFAPGNWHVFDWATARIDRLRRIDWQGERWFIVIFVLIMALGISFRFTRLDSVPREMTSDHVEKIQDAYRVSTGDYKIFFPNNGGREPVQMYLIAMLSALPGLGFDFFTLKFLAALESALTLPLLYWMGSELLGGRRARFNKVAALLLVALVAASYWHVIISRQGLRIPFTPAVTAVLLVYLSRAMRFNRRGDYIKAALALGFGLYTYQAVRMLPVLIIIGLIFAIWMRAAGWREKLRYLLHLSILVFISLMVFLPMLHFWLDYPNSFWMRASTRILGDHLAFSTVEQAIEALRANVPFFMHNMRNALLMYNWKGDIGWFNGAAEHPVLDTVTGAFLILGAAAWLAKMIKSRDPVICFMPIVVLVMLLPTVLSLAHPQANPSNSRALGTVPIIYLFAALPLAMLALRLKETFTGRKGAILALVFALGVVLSANHQNRGIYFERYAPAYLGPAFPHSVAGEVVRGFTNSGGAIGNVWSVGFPFWWDYRALGIEAGYALWPNDMYPMEDLPIKLEHALQRSDRYRLDPNRDLLFLYNPADEQTAQRLREWFPQGRALTVQTYQPEDSFVLYRVPSLGESGFADFLAQDEAYHG